MRKLTCLLIATLLVLSMFSIAYIPTARSTEEFPDYEPMDWQISQSGWQGLPEIGEASDEGVSAIESFLATPAIGTKAYDWYLEQISRNTQTGTQPWMTLRAVTGNVEVWTQDYLWFLPGDPRNDPLSAASDYGYALKVSDEMCQYLADQFNAIIYPTDISYFGKPLDRDGTNTIFQQLGYDPKYWDWIATDNPQRVIVKILNYRDANYANPNYPSYVVGFYSATYTRTYYKRNMIHIDPWRAWQRLGPEGKQWFLERPDLVVPSNRAYLLDSTLAHEFQHNIHRDFNPNDATFMNEGCSDYAQLLCGYPNTIWSHVNYFLYTPDNSLTAWSDQGDINILADYGAALLWAAYLVDHYGGPAFLSHFVQAGIPGIAGVDATLAYYNYTERFDDVHRDWRIANLIRSDFPGNGKYNYKSIDLNGPLAIASFKHTVSGLPVPLTKGTDFGTTWALNGYDTGIAMIGPYGSDYIVMNNWTKIGLISFDGDDTAIVPGWTYSTADGWWWSGRANMMNTLIEGQAYVDPANPTLQLLTRWDTEALWDYGFVQVSTDGGITWVSQANANTTTNHDPGAMASIVANLPGLTGRSQGWTAFKTITFDLTAYAGQTVLIGFRYMTDASTLGTGWYIQSAAVSGTALSLTPVFPPAYFQVTVVYAFVICGKTVYLPLDMWLCDKTNEGFGLGNLKPNYVILVVSSITPSGFVDYQFQAAKLGIRANYGRQTGDP